MGVYENVKEVCDEKNIPIYKVEKAAGLANGVIGGWKDAKGTPQIGSVIAVARALHVPLLRLTKGVQPTGRSRNGRDDDQDREGAE